VDHRLVRQEYLPRADHRTWALYLFLVTVADVQGLSYYSDASLGRHLHLDTVQLSAARRQLIDLDLIAYRKPLYQVLSLPEAAPLADNSPRSGQARSVAEVLCRVLEKGGAQ
jgi:hypothetical protein